MKTVSACYTFIVYNYFKYKPPIHNNARNGQTLKINI